MWKRYIVMLLGWVKFSVDVTSQHHRVKSQNHEMENNAPKLTLGMKSVRKHTSCHKKY